MDGVDCMGSVVYLFFFFFFFYLEMLEDLLTSFT